jgi:hypothetical protein
MEFRITSICTNKYKTKRKMFKFNNTSLHKIQNGPAYCRATNISKVIEFEFEFLYTLAVCVSVITDK